MLKFLSVILCLFLSGLSVLKSANNETFKIEDYSYKDGLTTTCVYSAFKDSKGFLWFCTINGLYRYDGYNFRNLSTYLDGFPNYETLCITEDKDQNLWIGTSGHGIFLYNTHEEKVFPINLSSSKNYKISQILFLQDKIWVASDYGLLVVETQVSYNEKDTLKTRVYWPDPPHKNSQINKITNLYFQPDDKFLWVGTNGGLFKFNMVNPGFIMLKTDPQNSIRCVSQYKNRIIAGSWDGGIFLVNPQNNVIENDEFIKYVNSIVSEKRIMTVYYDNNNRLWLATYGSGLYIFEKEDHGSFSYQNFRNIDNQVNNLKSDIINFMYPDNTGIVWLCMNQPALSKVYYLKNNLNYFNLSANQSDNYNKEIITLSPSIDKNKIWVTTNRQGLYLFDVTDNSFINYTTSSSSQLQLAENDVNNCYQDKDGNLWLVFRRSGLYVVPAKESRKLMKPNSGVHIKPINANSLLSFDSRINSYITKLFQDSKGRIWFGAWGALNIANINSDFSEADNINDLAANFKVSLIYITDLQDEVNFQISPILNILEVDKDKYYLSTSDGGILQLTEISNLNFEGKYHDISKKLPSNNVKVILRDKIQRYWIGTNAGLCLWDGKSDSIRLLTEKDGLTSININNIIEDEHSNLWVSTSYGISRINGKDFKISNFFLSDREKFNQYIPNAAIKINSGLICFSTNDGLVTLHPDSINIEKSNPPLYITDIRIDNQTVTPFIKYRGKRVIDANINECKKINVPYNHTLNIEFAALDYFSADRILYKYRIGNKNEWITLKSNQRNLILPSLKPGEYSLSIKLAGSDSDNSIRKITLNYLPPLWQSKPAFAIYTIFLLILFLTYRKLIIQRVMQKSVIEKERYERKKLEELDRMKSEFFTNISHEFRTPLSLIINPLENLSKDAQLTDNNKDKVNLILKSSNRLLKLTNELMDFGKIEKKLLKPELQLCDIVNLVKDSCRLFNNLADTMNIDFKFNSQFDQFQIPIDCGMIEKVIFNLLSNAFKYTPKSGVIMVNISRAVLDVNEFIKISVVNTGEGISHDNLDKVFDRYYQVSNIQNRNIAGTGIGLSLVKSFIELHNGKVEVKSEPRVETSFDIYLPFEQPGFNTSETQDKTISSLSNKEIVGAPGNPLSAKPTYHYQLLLVEDEEDIRNYIADELSSDFKISLAKDGEEGLQMAQEICPDLIITDIIMPRISGTELCITLKKQITTSHIPIIILSAKATVEQQIEGLEMGADVYMVKPFNIDYLRTQILRLIQLKENIYARFLKENTLVPDGALSTKIDEEFIQKVLKFIDENLSNTELSVDQLADHVALSKVQVYRKIKAISGQSVVEFIRTVRLKKAAEMVLEKKLSFFEIAYETGFSTPSYFTKCFHDHFGKTPTEFATDYGNKIV